MSELAPSWQRLRRRDDRLRRTFDALLRGLEPSIVCEVGAFNGDETLRFHGLTPSSKFFMFEANRQNFDQFLLGNPRLASHRNTTIEHVAVTDKLGPVEFHVFEAEEAAADWRRAASSMLTRTDGLPSRKEIVQGITLDDYFSSRSTATDTFALWIDVEGVLDRVLRGARHVLERTLVLRAEVEWHRFWQGQALGQESKDLIESFGFVCIGDSFTPDTHPQSDVLYIRRDAIDLTDPPV